jgi:RecA/RadA recombinase
MPRTKKKQTEVDYLKRIADGVEDMMLVSDMEEERVVPTMLTGFNRAVAVGGLPLGYITIVHGPNQTGKSVLALALAESVRKRGHVSMVFDTEFAGEKEWYGAITPRSGYKRTGNLNEMERSIRRMIKNLKKGKAAKKDRIPENIGCCFVIDTMTKLMPEELLKKIDEKGIEKQFPIQAGFVSLWSKWAIPELFRTGSSAIIVLQEREKVDAQAYGKKYKVTLGKTLQYDNRLAARVSSSKKVVESEQVVGFDCKVSVLNNKFAGTTYEEFHLFTSNGFGSVPKGLDLVRDAVEEAKHRGWVTKRDNAVVVKKDKAVLLKVRGGWANLRERLLKDEESLGKLVGALNSEVL